MVSIIDRTSSAEERTGKAPTCLALLPSLSYIDWMKSFTVRLPDDMVDRLEAEAKQRKMSKSDIVRERLSRSESAPDTSKLSPLIADLAGSVDGLPPDLSSNVKAYLRLTGYGRKRNR